MNPRESFDIGYDHFSDCDDEIEQLQQEVMVERLTESARKSKEANAAFNDLCDALGVELHGTAITGGGEHFRMSVKDMQTIVGRIEALKVSVLADGAL